MKNKPKNKSLEQGICPGCGKSLQNKSIPDHIDYACPSVPRGGEQAEQIILDLQLKHQENLKNVGPDFFQREEGCSCLRLTSHEKNSFCARIIQRVDFNQPIVRVRTWNGKQKRVYVRFVDLSGDEMRLPLSDFKCNVAVSFLGQLRKNQGPREEEEDDYANFPLSQRRVRNPDRGERKQRGLFANSRNVYQVIPATEDKPARMKKVNPFRFSSSDSSGYGPAGGDSSSLPSACGRRVEETDEDSAGTDDKEEEEQEGEKRGEKEDGDESDDEGSGDNGEDNDGADERPSKRKQQVGKHKKNLKETKERKRERKIPKEKKEEKRGKAEEEDEEPPKVSEDDGSDDESDNSGYGEKNSSMPKQQVRKHKKNRKEEKKRERKSPKENKEKKRREEEEADRSRKVSEDEVNGNESDDSDCGEKPSQPKQQENKKGKKEKKRENQSRKEKKEKNKVEEEEEDGKVSEDEGKPAQVSEEEANCGDDSDYGETKPSEPKQKVKKHKKNRKEKKQKREEKKSRKERKKGNAKRNDKEKKEKKSEKEKEETESEEKKTSSKAEKKVDHRKLPTLFDYHRRKTKNQLKKIRKPWVQPLWYLELKDEKKDLEFDSVPDWMDIESLVAGTTTDGGAMISIGKLRVLFTVCLKHRNNGGPAQILRGDTGVKTFASNSAAIRDFFRQMATDGFNHSTKQNYHRALQRLVDIFCKHPGILRDRLTHDQRQVFSGLEVLIRQFVKSGDRGKARSRQAIHSHLRLRLDLTMALHNSIFRENLTKLYALLRRRKDTRLWKLEFVMRFTFALFVIPNRPSFFHRAKVADFHKRVDKKGHVLFWLLPKTEKSDSLSPQCRNYFLVPHPLVPVLEWYFAFGRQFLRPESDCDAFLIDEKGEPLKQNRISAWFRIGIEQFTGKSITLKEYRRIFTNAVEGLWPLHNSHKSWIHQQQRHTRATVQQYYNLWVLPELSHDPVEVQELCVEALDLGLRAKYNAEEMKNWRLPKRCREEARCESDDDTDSSEEFPDDAPAVPDLSSSDESSLYEPIRRKSVPAAATSRAWQSMILDSQIEGGVSARKFPAPSKPKASSTPEPKPAQKTSQTPTKKQQTSRPRESYAFDQQKRAAAAAAYRKDAQKTKSVVSRKDSKKAQSTKGEPDLQVLGENRRGDDEQRRNAVASRKAGIRQIDSDFQTDLNKLAEPNTQLNNFMMDAQRCFLRLRYPDINCVSQFETRSIEKGEPLHVLPRDELPRNKPSVIFHLHKGHWRLVIAMFQPDLKLYILDSIESERSSQREVQDSLRASLRGEVPGQSEISIVWVRVPKQTDATSCGLFVIYWSRRFAESNLTEIPNRLNWRLPEGYRSSLVYQFMEMAVVALQVPPTIVTFEKLSAALAKGGLKAVGEMCKKSKKYGTYIPLTDLIAKDIRKFTRLGSMCEDELLNHLMRSISQDFPQDFACLPIAQIGQPNWARAHRDRLQELFDQNPRTIFLPLLEGGHFISMWLDLETQEVKFFNSLGPAGDKSVIKMIKKTVLPELEAALALFNVDVKDCSIVSQRGPKQSASECGVCMLECLRTVASGRETTDMKFGKEWERRARIEALESYFSQSID